MKFDLILAVDWSAAERPTSPNPAKDAIWICADLQGSRSVAYFRTRRAALYRIADWLAQGHRTLLGFDFAFGFPRGFARAATGEDRALAVWDRLAEMVEDGPDNANNRFEVAARLNASFPGTGPFWGHPQGRTYPNLPAKKTARHGHGLPEHRTCEAGSGAKSVWQVAYAGAVGSQSLVGLAALAGLRHAHPDLAVWPMQTGFTIPDARIVLAEIYPSLFDAAAQDHPIKDARQVMATAAALRAAPDDWWTAPGGVEDPERVAMEEGWILGVGTDGPLTAPAPGDCFALPPGVDWTPVDTALAALRAGCAPVTGAQTVPVGEAAGRILAADVTARRANPPHANAAVDGWGFAHAALPEGPVPIAPGRAAAGHPHPGPVPPGRALRILTGAPLPEGVDTVALQEDAEATGGHVTFRAIPRPGANTRPAAEDVSPGDRILSAGAILRPGDLGLAIAGGLSDLPVRAALRVGVLSTGDEIVPPGGDGIPDVNRPMLLAMLAGWGLTPVDLGHVGDDAQALAARLDGAGVDAILTSGGASDGAEDHLSRLMRERGTVAHWRIAVKPGRPLMLGRWNGTPLFGLPGNPVAAFTCAALFARPALLQLAGAGWTDPPRRTVPAGFTKRKKGGRREYLRARIREGRAEVFASEGSGRVSGLSWAEGFVELPEEAMQVHEGDPVRYIAFSDLGIG